MPCPACWIHTLDIHQELDSIFLDLFLPLQRSNVSFLSPGEQVEFVGAQAEAVKHVLLQAKVSQLTWNSCRQKQGKEGESFASAFWSI